MFYHSRRVDSGWYLAWLLAVISVVLLGAGCGRGTKQTLSNAEAGGSAASLGARPVKFTTYTDSEGNVVKLLCYSQRLSAERLSAAGEFSAVRELFFQECSGFDSAVVRKLQQLTSLEQLSIFNTPLDQSSLDALAELKTLKAVRLINCGLQGKNLNKMATLPLEIVEILDRELTAEVADTVAQISTLKYLKLGSPLVAIADLRSLRQHPSIQEIDLALCETGEQWVPLVASIANLKRCRFNTRKLDDATLAQLVEISTLEELDLSNSPVTNASLRLLGDLPNLKSLTLNNCKNLNDEALLELAKLPRLTRLDISEASITASALEHLIPLASLRELIIHQMQVRGSRAGLTTFQQARPDCAVTVEQDLMF